MMRESENIILGRCKCPHCGRELPSAIVVRDDHIKKCRMNPNKKPYVDIFKEIGDVIGEYYD